MIPGPIQTPKEPLTAALDLFDAYSDADNYRARTGQPAPGFDPSQPRKAWADPSAATAPDGPAANGVIYEGASAFYPILILSKAPDYAQTGKWTAIATTYILSRGQAGSINLPSYADRDKFQGGVQAYHRQGDPSLLGSRSTP